jgi:hypothetical protein
MNTSYPPSGRAALVSFVILVSSDTTLKAVDKSDKAAGIDDEALKIVNNFWTDLQLPGRHDTADRLDHKLPS